MASPDPPGRGGAHRAPATPGTVARSFAGPLIAVAAVVLVIVLLVFLNGRPAPKGTPAVERQVTAAHTTHTTPPTSARPSPSRTPTPVQTTTAAAVVTTAPVTVLNNSRYDGLAAKVAADVRSAGWPVGDVGNFAGRVAETTIYYAPGQQQVARAFAARFPKVRRMLPRFAALPGSGLTLVVTRDWVG